MSKLCPECSDDLRPNQWGNGYVCDNCDTEYTQDFVENVL